MQRAGTKQDKHLENQCNYRQNTRASTHTAQHKYPLYLNRVALHFYENQTVLTTNQSTKSYNDLFKHTDTRMPRNN